MLVEILVLAVIAIGLIRRRGEHWEFSRQRVAHAVDRISDAGGTAVGRARRSLPELFAVCFADVRNLLEDVAGVLQPRARRRIEDGARGLLARKRRRKTRRARQLDALPAGAAIPAALPAERETVSGRAQRAYQNLQRRYLEGAISLDQYVDEAGRLRSDDPAAS